MIGKKFGVNLGLLVAVALLASVLSPFRGGLSVSTASSIPSPTQANTTSLIAQIQHRGELRVCFGPAQPHSYIVNGQWVGIAVDIMKDWATVLGVKFVPVSSTFGAMIAAVQAGRCDVAAALNQRPARALSVIFSTPYIDDIGVFIVNIHKSKARTWQQLNTSGVTVCVVQGAAEDLSLTSAPHSVTLLRLADENACRLAFQSGRVDAFFDDISGNLSYAQAHPEARIIDPQPALEKEGIAFAINQGYGYGDIQPLDIEIDHVTNEGILPALEKKYGLVTNLTPYENR